MNTIMPIEYYPYMTVSQFNQFIKEQRLTQGNRFQPVKNGNQCNFGPGWNSITVDLILDLIIMGWNKNFITIGTKKGKGVFKILNGTQEMHDRIKIWQNQCTKMCDCCGSTEDVRTEKHSDNPFIPLYFTLCIICRDNDKASIEQIRAETARYIDHHQ